MKINIVNIGCFKNLVDSERLMKQLCQQGNEVIFGRSDSYFDVVIINNGSLKFEITAKRLYAASQRVL